MDPNKAHYVVATGILVKDGKYLIAKRADHEKVFPSKWTVPGGKLEVSDYKDRTPDTQGAKQWYNICEDVIRREMMEEVGLKIKNINYLASLTFIRPDGIPTLVISLFGQYDGGEVILSEDLSDYVWVTLAEAKNYDLIDGIYEEIELLDKHLKGNDIGVWKRKD